jgi:lipid-A-disaccharide synthase
VRIALVAGEASGDLLGADLLGALRERLPGAEFAGIGGPGMRGAGLDAWWDCGELAVMGLAEVLRHLPRLLRLRRELVARAIAWRPDAYVGIDAPDFNLGVERRLKARGIRTVHLVSPSVWAWREGRAAKIGRSADRVLCLFPMEPPIYARHGVDARFVGHPLADRFALEPDRTAAREALGLRADAPVLAVLPGSRLGEIGRLGGVFAEAAARVAADVPGLVAIAPMANAACRAAFAPIAAAHLPALRLLDGQAHQALVAADVVLLASGTAALEGMLAKRPMVVGYRIAPLTHWIVRTFGLMRIDRYALPNVLAGEDLAPELMQDDCTPDNLAGAVLRWFREPAAVAALLPRYRAIHLALRRDAARAAAAEIADLLAATGSG